eukprot:gnl/Dysnectes_brevis/7193_a11829_130.p1 GENE.gnl/Dysnectes_brevis/7193_a11829_130~~gnl/Dysnectes_brevis/7193_a11829_130.p1  ORF type:complete len:451 (+),score=204.11 gnl/Dysnectes_brevis/7193_a11829_130:734-2086(+)
MSVEHSSQRASSLLKLLGHVLEDEELSREELEGITLLRTILEQRQPLTRIKFTVKGEGPHPSIRITLTWAGCLTMAALRQSFQVGRDLREGLWMGMDIADFKDTLRITATAKRHVWRSAEGILLGLLAKKDCELSTLLPTINDFPSTSPAPCPLNVLEKMHGGEAVPGLGLSVPAMRRLLVQDDETLELRARSVREVLGEEVRVLTNFLTSHRKQHRIKAIDVHAGLASPGGTPSKDEQIHALPKYADPRTSALLSLSSQIRGTPRNAIKLHRAVLLRLIGVLEGGPKQLLHYATMALYPPPRSDMPAEECFELLEIPKMLETMRFIIVHHPEIVTRHHKHFLPAYTLSARLEGMVGAQCFGITQQTKRQTGHMMSPHSPCPRRRATTYPRWSAGWCPSHSTRGGQCGDARQVDPLEPPRFVGPSLLYALHRLRLQKHRVMSKSMRSLVQ